MRPERPAVGHLIKLGNPRAAFVRFDVLGNNIHGDFFQIQIGADSRRRDASRRQYVV